MTFFKSHGIWIVSCYVIASVWLTATAASAYHVFSTPISQPQIISTPQIMTPSLEGSLMIPEADVAIPTRNPFSMTGAPVMAAAQGAPFSPSGLKLKAIILSKTNGVVIEDAGGGVYFLSEGETANGILVKTITKSVVAVEVNGNKVDLRIGGE
ncbi:MAG: hypothetical protein HQL19_01000 [Candidatus Omnitrophica bacterium]|nr:hypothetical protein [Candidatus Omnitrophota bacterium]